MAGRAGKPKPRRRAKQEGPERPVSFRDPDARLPSMGDRPVGIEGINVQGQPEIPVEEVRGPGIREQVEAVRDNLSPAQRLMLGAAAAAASGKVEGSIPLGPRPARRRD